MTCAFCLRTEMPANPCQDCAFLIDQLITQERMKNKVPACHLCKSTSKGRHKEGCKWKVQTYFFRGARVKRLPKGELSECRCDAGHEFRSNLLEPICYVCRSKNVTILSTFKKPPEQKAEYVHFQSQRKKDAADYSAFTCCRMGCERMRTGPLWCVVHTP